MTVGAARGVDRELLADTLPAAERAIVSSLQEEDGGLQGDDG
jgi:hypothetical protein